jgi:hypothetical protein
MKINDTGSFNRLSEAQVGVYTYRKLVVGALDFIYAQVKSFCRAERYTHLNS